MEIDMAGVNLYVKSVLLPSSPRMQIQNIFHKCELYPNPVKIGRI